ncbi:hypothetical protein GA417_14670, partial [Poseidonibacter ostreae]
DKSDLGVDGAKSITAVVTDAAGNASTASDATTITVDTTAPVVSSVDLNSDTGESSSDGITNSGVVNVTLGNTLAGGER